MAAPTQPPDLRTAARLAGASGGRLTDEQMRFMAATRIVLDYQHGCKSWTRKQLAEILKSNPVETIEEVLRVAAEHWPATREPDVRPTSWSGA